MAQSEARKQELADKRAARAKEREGETKAQAFKRLANNRTNKALDAIALLRSLSSTANYEYTADQAKAITDALTAGVAKVAADFAAGGPQRAEHGFNL